MKTAEDTPLAALATDFGNGEVTMMCGTAGARLESAPRCACIAAGGHDQP
jgi:hypothetical protein